MYMVRGTELSDFLRCRLKWKYTWLDHLKPKKENQHLLAGSLMHKFLETWYSTGSVEQAHMAMDDLASQAGEIDQLEWDDVSTTLAHVTGNYVSQYADDLTNWEVIATELTFAIPLDDEIGYSGTIDLIVRDKEGKIWFLDHKYTKSIETYDKNSDLDRQISRYWWALQQLQQGNGQVKDGDEWFAVWDTGLKYSLANEIGGFVYNIILKDYPVPPKVLKNGSLSKDKSQRTTYEMYRNELVNNRNHNIADYEDILTWLRDNPREYFRRLRVTRTQSEINASIEELYSTAIDMDALKDETKFEYKYSPFYRNITKDCPWCPFQPICQASMDGSNVDFLKESLYTKEEVK